MTSSYVDRPSASWSSTPGSSAPNARQRSSRPFARRFVSFSAKVSPPPLCWAPMTKFVSAGALVKA